MRALTQGWDRSVGSIEWSRDGRSLLVTADDTYLRDSILVPRKQVAAGYAPVMPTYQGQLGEEELFELIAYIKSLE